MYDGFYCSVYALPRNFIVSSICLQSPNTRHKFLTKIESLRESLQLLHAKRDTFNLSRFSVMGPTGAGKSTVRVFSSSNIWDFDRPQFIEMATGQDGQTVGHGLQSRTAVIRTVRVIHPKTGRPIVFVDTPGFDDTYKSDTEILSMIADWLVRT